MTKFFKSLIAGEEGATMVEYALMVALIAAALITAVGALTGSITTTLTGVGTTISGAAPSGS